MVSMSVDPAFGLSQAVKPVSALHISCRFGGNGPGGAGVHWIVMLFMYLDVLAEFSTDVLVIIMIDLDPVHEFSWLNISGDTICQWVYIRPEIAHAHHLNHQHSWHFLEGKGILDAMTPFFQCPYASFYHWNMFFTGTFVECYPQWGELTSQGLELSVNFNKFKCEPTLHICALLSSRFSGMWSFQTWLRDLGYEEGHLVDSFNVNIQYHLPIVVRSCSGDGDHSPTVHLVRCFSHCFFF